MRYSPGCEDFVALYIPFQIHESFNYAELGWLVPLSLLHYLQISYWLHSSIAANSKFKNSV